MDDCKLFKIYWIGQFKQLFFIATKAFKRKTYALDKFAAALRVSVFLLILIHVFTPDYIIVRIQFLSSNFLCIGPFCSN